MSERERSGPFDGVAKEFPIHFRPVPEWSREVAVYLQIDPSRVLASTTRRAQNSHNFLCDCFQRPTFAKSLELLSSSRIFMLGRRSRVYSWFVYKHSTPYTKKKVGGGG
jgi:hypothetical protein